MLCEAKWPGRASWEFWELQRRGGQMPPRKNRINQQQIRWSGQCQVQLEIPAQERWMCQGLEKILRSYEQEIQECINDRIFSWGTLKKNFQFCSRILEISEGNPG